MKKQEQIKLNEEVRNILSTKCNQYFECPFRIHRFYYDTHLDNQLYHCNAYIYRFYNGVMLESYATCVAWYDFETKNVYDFLRLAYGYTATSSQHIHKFAKYYNAKRIISYKEV